jgi:hypothetical protein
MTKYQLQLFGSEASRAKTYHLLEWANGKDLEAVSLDYFMSLLDWLEKVSPEFLLSKTLQVSLVRTKEGILECSSTRWPKSGMLLDGVLLTAKTSESPNRASASTLSDVIETGEVQRQYFLSPNAARGILRRVDRMGRKLRPHLRKSLEILAEKDQ